MMYVTNLDFYIMVEPREQDIDKIGSVELRKNL
jgi:hypothetical protein